MYSVPTLHHTELKLKRILPPSCETRFLYRETRLSSLESRDETLSRAKVPCIEVILRDLPGPSTFPGWPTTGPSGFWSPEWVSGKGQQWIGDLKYRHVWPSNNPDRSNLAMPYGSHGLSRLVNGLWVVRRPAIKQFSFISIHLVIL